MTLSPEFLASLAALDTFEADLVQRALGVIEPHFNNAGWPIPDQAREAKKWSWFASELSYAVLGRGAGCEEPLRALFRALLEFSIANPGSITPAARFAGLIEPHLEHVPYAREVFIRALLPGGPVVKEALDLIEVAREDQRLRDEASAY